MPLSSLPNYLKRYISGQDYEAYTAQDHAAWRYIMRNSQKYFEKHALPIYLEGLSQTGISSERIPRVEEMDEKLKKLGWGAVAVTGFIPPAAFLDFQARKILPIATDMRSIDHIEYTPAPDIVHEAAGHAPIIADPAYSKYLTKYAAMAQKAIFVKEDLDVYEAIRTLSDVKENPDSTPALIAHAEARLKEAVTSVNIVSEAAKTARMNWWTVEYGLMGDLQHPQIFGAGLLSSIGESQNCLSNSVKKIPLSIDCVETSYDITEPQPQLFVARDMDHLVEVLEQFEATLSFRRGGAYGLSRAVEARTVNTVELKSGIQLSGKLVAFESPTTKEDQIEFIKFEGPTQLSRSNQELTGHGIARHEHGFSSPIGPFAAAPELDPNCLRLRDLERLDLKVGSTGVLKFSSGFEVRGELTDVQCHGEIIEIMTWTQCTVKRGETVYFQPEWGEFDMVLGDGVVSVFGGAADRERYGMHDVGNATTKPGRQSPYTTAELSCFEVYQQVRDYRQAAAGGVPPDEGAYENLIELIIDQYPNEWLLHLEATELGKILGYEKQTKEFLDQAQRLSQKWSQSERDLFQKGLSLH